MSRFFLTTLLAVILFFSIGCFLSGWTRWAAFTAMWIVYLTLVSCGIAFIRMQFFGKAVCHGKPGRMKVALTFDDGPDPAATPTLLDLLRHEKIPATFFCIGERVSAHPEIVARIAAEGHLLGNHTYRHSWWSSMHRSGRLTQEVSLTQDAIRQTTGITPRFMRPPVGMTNPHFAGVLRRAGLTMIGWDVRSMDTRWPPRDVIDRVLRQVVDGSIILLHDGDRPPEEVLEIVAGIVANLRGRGFGFERVDRLIDDTAATVIACS